MILPCLIIEGEGRLTDLATGAVHRLEPDTMYVLDRHRIDADTDMRIVCVFSPALVGPETHDEDGSYPAPEDESLGREASGNATKD